MTEQEFLVLLDRFKQGSLSEASRRQLADAVASGAFDALLQQDIMDELGKEAPAETAATEAEVQTLLSVYRKAEKSARPRTYIRYAAAILLLLAGTFGTFLYRSRLHVPEAAPVAATIMPGSNKAVLTLADGQQVELDDKNTTPVPLQGSTAVQAANGRLTYSGSAEGTTLFNTLHTPGGGQYQLVLQDGTRVWLNASSTLTFPTAFSEKERRVQLQGEAYFEVSRDTRRPFVVNAKAMEVTVLGTHFNMMTYEDEQQTRTTLLEGAVAVRSHHTQYRLQPGQEAIRLASGQVQVQPADTEAATAWVKGLFLFNETDLATGMRQIARWYNVEVEYHGNPDHKKLTGEIFRNYSLQQALKVLSAAGLTCKLEGKKLIVIF